MNNLFVTCGHTLEPLLAEELTELGCTNVQPGYRGVSVADTPDAIYRINYCSRLATRVLQPLKNFRCQNARSLYTALRDLDWATLIPPHKTFAIDANVTHPQLRNSLFAAQVVKDAICDTVREACGERPSVSVKRPDVQLNLFINQQQGILSYDTSGEALTKRGYRTDAVEAPLHENLAAALLRLANYKADDIVCDPCCGSGTLLIEAALIGSKTAPGFMRQHWGFMKMPTFDEKQWLAFKEEVDSQRVPLKPGRLMGCDQNKNAVRISKSNVKTAGLNAFIDITCSDFRAYTPPQKPNFIITNPPHGRRLETEDTLVPLYRALGDFMKENTLRPARGFVFTGSLELSKEIGLAPKQRHVIDNSGVDSRFLEFDIF